MSKNIVKALAQAWACVLFPVLGVADAGSVSVEELMARGLNGTPMVGQIEARTAAQRSAGTSIALLENPNIDAEVRIPKSYSGSRGSDEVAASLSQPIRLSDFGARGRVDELIQKGATVEEKVALLELMQRIRLAYAKTWALETRVNQLSTYVQRASTLEASVKKASESGYLGAGEGYLFKAEVLKSKYQVEAITADAQRARAELSKVVGFSVEGTLNRPKFAPIPDAITAPIEGEELPSAARARLGEKLAKEQLRLAELDAYPKFAPRLVYERTGDDTDYYGAGISIDLPFFNRNQGEKAVRRAELSSAQRNLSYFVGDGFKNEVAALKESLTSSSKLLEGYEREILPSLRQALGAEEKLLSSGQGSFFRVWQTLRELSSAESEFVEQTIRVFSDRAELAVLVGRDF